MKKFEDSHVNAVGVFPDTVAIDASSPSATDGTEWIKGGIDDWWGWVQALLTLGGVTPSGVNETKTASDILDAQKSLFWFDNLITGLLLSNNGADAQHDIDVATGKTMDSTNAYLFKLTSGLTKRLDASWVVGTGNGGLFTGAIAASTWYAVFLIRKDSDGSIDSGFDTSDVAANIPAGYTAFKRIGWVFTDASSNIYAFTDREVAGGSVERAWNDFKHSLQTTFLATRQLLTLAVPQNTIAIANHQLEFSAGSGGETWLLPTTATDVAPVQGAASTLSITATATRASIETRLQVDSSSQVAWRCSAASISEIDVITLGYIDPRI